MLVPTQQALGGSKHRPDTALDRQKLDQGKQALKKLLADKRRAKSKRLRLVDYLRIYGSIIAGLMIIAGFGFLLFLVPIKIDPAWATLNYEFYPEPVVVYIEEVFESVGLSNVDWCSCTEGCTSDVFACFSIVVSYSKLPNGKYYPSKRLESEDDELVELYPEEEEAETDMEEGQYLSMSMERGEAHIDSARTIYNNSNDSLLVTNYTNTNYNRSKVLRRNRRQSTQCRYCRHCDVCDARLLVNVKGCGYPPYVNCSSFREKFNTPGRRIPGYYSDLHPNIVLASYDPTAMKVELQESVGYTFGLMAIGTILMCILQAPYRKMWRRCRGKKKKGEKSE